MPIALSYKVENKMILIIGGGKVGYRKAKKLIEEGAQVTCVSMSFNELFKKSDVSPSNSGTIKCIKKAYSTDDLTRTDFQWVIAATDQIGVNAQIYEEAHQLKIPCMTVDGKNPSDFSFMSSRKKACLTIAVDTQGLSPKFASVYAQKLIEGVTETDLDELKESIQLRNKNNGGQV